MGPDQGPKLFAKVSGRSRGGLGLKRTKLFKGDGNPDDYYVLYERS